MNKVYRTVWNEHTNTWVAVQETAKAHRKSGRSSLIGESATAVLSAFGFKAATLTASMMSLYVTSNVAQAAPGIYINDAYDNGCIATFDSNSSSGIFGVDTDNGTAPLIAGGSTAHTMAHLSSFGASSSYRPCVSVANPSFGVASVSGAESRDTQTNRTLFYGESWGQMIKKMARNT